MKFQIMVGIHVTELITIEIEFSSKWLKCCNFPSFLYFYQLSRGRWGEKIACFIIFEFRKV